MLLTPAGSVRLALEGLQYTGLRSGSPFTRKVYCGTAGMPLPAAGSTQHSITIAESFTLKQTLAFCLDTHMPMLLGD